MKKHNWKKILRGSELSQIQNFGCPFVISVMAENIDLIDAACIY